jgi:gamma-glutamylcyclotransferase (GGCT)/AIG2-like uncharacterized protein YtfP
MWVKQMKDRCPNHQIVGSGVLKNYRWIISSRGYANIVKSPQSVVYGVVYKISESDECSLDRWEGVTDGSYRKEMLDVVIDESTQTCLVYIDPIEDEGLPKTEYIVRINNGIEDARLPWSYVQKTIRKFVPNWHNTGE